MAAGSVPVGESASAFDNGQPLNCETHERPRQSRCGAYAPTPGSWTSGGAYWAAKAELRYWAMPLGGFAKGDSPAAIAQAAQRRVGYRTRSVRNYRAALYLISENRNADPTLWPLAKYEAIFREMLDFWWQRRPTVPRAACC
jgi:hypothetical protein